MVSMTTDKQQILLTNKIASLCLETKLFRLIQYYSDCSGNQIIIHYLKASLFQLLEQLVYFPTKVT